MKPTNSSPQRPDEAGGYGAPITQSSRNEAGRLSQDQQVHKLRDCLSALSGSIYLLDSESERDRYIDSILDQAKLLMNAASDLADGREECNAKDLANNVVSPPAARKGSDPAKLHDRSADRSKTTVLLVDDEELFLFATQSLLGKHGFQVFVADNADKAIEIVQRQQIDFLFTDLSMPDGDGYSILTRLRSLGVCAGTFVCAASAHTSIKIRDDVRRAGFDGFVEKPFRVESLIALIDQHRSRTNQT